MNEELGFQALGVAAFAVPVVGAVMLISSLSGPKEAPAKPVEKPAVVQADPKAEAAAAEKARLDAMTPEERDKELKQKAFESARSMYGSLLTATIKKNAFDEDALKLKRPVYYNNGVCVEANGKNRFGAYVGWQEHCYIYKDDKWTYRGPNA